ncbi:MAG: type VI secretion system tube protein TssD [Myxococcota bacterium]
MALNSYLKFTGESQGEVKGSVTQSGREDSIMVIGWVHGVKSPRDLASGMATGKRQHQPFTIIKEIDKSTPLIMNVLVNNENITDWELRCWQPSNTGVEEQQYTVKLYNATVSEVQSESLNNKYPENLNHKERERVSFTYQKIEWIWELDGIMAADDWETPVV